MLLVVVILSVAEAQLYPTLIQQRPVFLPSHLHQHLQLSGTVPVYEAVGPPHPSAQVIGTSIVSPPTQGYAVQSVMQPMLQTISPLMVQSLTLQQAYPYSYGYTPQKQEGPLKRFLRGAADGFMLGTMAWLG